MVVENQQLEPTQQVLSTPLTPPENIIQKPLLTLPIVSKSDLIQLNEGVEARKNLVSLRKNDEK